MRSIWLVPVLVSILILGSAFMIPSAIGAFGPPIIFNNPTPEVDDIFGFSVSISGNNVLLGARFDDTGAFNAGSAYLFDATTGALLKTFNNPTPVLGDDFGVSVSISGNNVLVGARFDDTGFTDAGSAYLFDTTTCDDDTSNGGTEGDGICEAATVTFNNPTPDIIDRFGRSVSISGNNVLVGTRSDDTGAKDAGSAYLFVATTCDDDTSNGGAEGDGICEAATVTFNNPTPTIDDLFGFPVSISGNKVLIGAPFDDTDATDAGLAYVFATSSIPVDIDIKPDSDKNKIKPEKGEIPVVILGSDTFDVTDVDVSTVKFGPNDAVPFKGKVKFTDKNEDGFLDLLVTFLSKETGIAPSDTSACIAGNTNAGIPIDGCDFIITK